MPSALRNNAQLSEAVTEVSLILLVLSCFASDIFGVPDAQRYGDMIGLARASQDDEETFMMLGTAYLAFSRLLLLRGPRGPYNQFEKCPEWFLRAFGYNDLWFRNIFRMSRSTFELLAKELTACPIFYTTGRKPQRPIVYQLGCFLIRYGHGGGNALFTAILMGIGFGSVINYSIRVTYALRSLGRKWLRWPSSDMRQLTKEWIYDRTGLRHVIGIVDGTLIQLTEPPVGSFAEFFCRKGFPAFNVQAIVDHLRRFINLDLGWPGSLVDVTLWKRSLIWLMRHSYFRRGEYVLADKGYPSSPYALRPFDEEEIKRVSPDERVRMREFNHIVSSVRVRVEQAFGMLKGRFPSLKLFSTPADINDAYRTFEALASVHNFCIDNEDHPESIPGYSRRDHAVDQAIREIREAIQRGEYAAVDEPEELPNELETPERLKHLGMAMRRAIFEEIVPP